MIIFNISILTFLIGLGIFSYSIYERSIVLGLEEQKLKTDLLNNDKELYKSEGSEIDKNLLDTTENLKSEILKNKIEIKEKKLQKNQLGEKINLLNLTKEKLESDLFNLKLEMSKVKFNLSKEQILSKEKNEVIQKNNENLLVKNNMELKTQLQQKNDIIIELEKQIKGKKDYFKDITEKNLQFTKAEFDDLKKNNEIYKKNNQKFELIIKKQKKQILELKSANLIYEKELKQHIKEDSLQKNSVGIIATFTGNLLYEPNKKRIVLISSDGTEYTILQDDFPGDLVAKCGLPISTNSKDRCIATILAELIVENDELILKGKEIKEITKND